MPFQSLRSIIAVVLVSTALAAGTVSRAEEAGASASATFGKIPLYFEPNLGQGPAGTDFLARGENYLALVTSEGVTLRLRSGSCGGSERNGPMNREAEALELEADAAETPCTMETATLRVEGRSEKARLMPEQKLEGISNYLMGKDSSRWLTHIPQFASVRVAEVYPGIDMVLQANGKNLRYDFEVKPGADPGRIRLRLEGAEKTELSGERLVHHLKGGRLEQLNLRVSQGAEKISGASFSVTTDGRIGFDVSGWNRREKLVIDPTLAWSTYLGGYGPEWAQAIAVDGSGNAYVTGHVADPVFPVTPGAYDTSYNGGTYGDAFVTKLNAPGTALVYSTYLGGSGPEEGYGIAVDASGNAYVTGHTDSSDFPTTPGAHDTTYNGGYDAFVTKLSATGTGLAYSTYLGGTSQDSEYDIAVDSSGSAYVTGWTNSSDFPTTAGAYDTSYNGGYDPIVTKLSATGTGLAYSTYLGGTSYDYGYGIAVDSSESVYVTGTTDSSDFPTTAGAYDTSWSGGYDVFVTKLNATGTGLVYSTYLGSGYDYGFGVAVDSSGSAHVTGRTYSSSFPTTAGAYDTSFNGGADVFVTKLNATGAFLLYSTYLGGTSNDVVHGIAVHSSGSVYVTGYTGSSDFPTTAGTYDTSYNGGYDAFVTKLNETGTGLAYSAFLGGSSYEFGYGIAVDASGSAYVTGYTGSSDFPTTPGALRTTIGGDQDAFVTKLSPTGAALAYSTFLGGAGGGAGDVEIFAINVDASGHAFLAGRSGSANFPVTGGAYDTTANGNYDVVVTQLNTSGTGVLYSTYIGGTNSEGALGIAVDSSGSAYVTGYSLSLDFPTSVGAFDTTINGSDAFVTRLSPGGASLLYSTFLGGSSSETGAGIALDTSGRAYVTGSTLSSDFPTTPGAYDSSYNGGQDAFVTTLNAGGTALVSSTYLGGSGDDYSRGITVDAHGNAYVSGSTTSSDFPVTVGAFDVYFGGLSDVFVVKVNAPGTSLDYSTYLGGASWDEGYGIAVDSSGGAYVTGYTLSSDFPTTPGAYDTTHESTGGADAFVAKLNATGTGLAYSTFIGGGSSDVAHGIAVDSAGSASVVGSTYSWDFPMTPDAYDPSWNDDLDVFVTKLNAAGSALLYSTFLGGTWEDNARGIALDGLGGIYVTGFTYSPDFPTTAGAFQEETPSGEPYVYSGFVTKFSLCQLTAAVSGTAVACAGAPSTIQVDLTGTAPWTLTWNDGVVQTAASSPATRVVAPLTTTTYTLTSVVDGSGCTGTMTGAATITVIPQPTATVTGGGTVCAGTNSTINVVLTGTAPWTITWNDGVVQIAGTSSATRQVSPTFAQSFSVAGLSDSKCAGGTSTGVAAFVVKPVPSAVITAAEGVCFSSTGNTASVPDGGPGTTYAWAITGGAITSATITNAITFTANASGNVVLTATVTKDSCPSVGTKTIPIETLPSAPVPAIPANGSTYSGAFVSWTHPGGTWYDVYLDTVNPPEKLIFSGETSNFEALVPSWVPGVTYYWKVAARNGCGTASSAVQSFVAGSCPWTGAAPVLTSPANGAGGIGATAALTWTGVAGTAHYDVYLGSSSGSLTRYDVVEAPQNSLAVPVSPGVTYSWKVVAVPVCGSAAAATSTTNSFTTSGTPFGGTAFTPSFFNRWETGTVTLSGSGFTAGMQLFTDFHGADAGTLVPAVFTNSFSSPNQLQATLIGNPAAPAGRYDVGVTLSGIEEGRLLQAMALRAFTDVTETDYYYLSSARMADAGIMEPDFNTSALGPQFSPSTNVPRALMAEYLAKSYQYWRDRTTALPSATCTPSGAGSTDFPDVPCSHPNWLAIHWIKTWGVTQGSPCAQGLCFNPGNNVTRAEMVTFIERLRQTGILNTLLSTVGETDPGCAVAYPACKGWSDAGGAMDVSGWPRREANLAFQDRITAGCSGTPGNDLKFCPNDAVSRAQIGEFLARTLGLVPMP